MTTASLTWLQHWYRAQCDGDWEHQSGVTIETLDNPGWALTIDLGGTVFESKAIEAVEIHRTDQDWLVYKTQDEKFLAACGPLNLGEAIDVFRARMSAISNNPKGH